MQRVVSMHHHSATAYTKSGVCVNRFCLPLAEKMVPCRIPRLWRWPVGRSCDEAHGCGVRGGCAPAVQRPAATVLPRQYSAPLGLLHIMQQLGRRFWGGLE